MDMGEFKVFHIETGPRRGFWFQTEADMRRTVEKMQPMAKAETQINEMAELSAMVIGTPMRVADEHTWALLQINRTEMIDRWMKGETASDLIAELCGLSTLRPERFYVGAVEP